MVAVASFTSLRKFTTDVLGNLYEVKQNVLKMEFESGFKQFRERKNVPDPLFKGSGTVFCPTVNVACVPYRLIFFPRVDFRYHSRSKFIG